MPIGLSMGAGLAIAGGLAAAGTVASGMMSSSAAKSAASAQAGAADRAAQMNQEQYQQTRDDLAPYNTQGQSALTSLNGQMSSLTAPFNPTESQLQQTPGYQFTRDQGLQGVQNAASARGLGISGAALKGAANYSTGLANSTYMDQFNVDQTNKTNAYNKLMGVAGLGENAAAQTGNYGTQAAQNAGNNLTAGANATAAGTIGSANAFGGALSSAANSGTNYLLYSKLLGGGGGAGGANADSLAYNAATSPEATSGLGFYGPAF